MNKQDVTCAFVVVSVGEMCVCVWVCVCVHACECMCDCICVSIAVFEIVPYHEYSALYRVLAIL